MSAMSVWAEQLHPDPLAEDVVPESVPHSRTARLVAQVISLAMPVAAAARVGHVLMLLDSPR